MEMYTQEALAVEEALTTMGVFATSIWFIFFLVGFIFFGVLTFKLAHHKGYKGYFWTGAFLGFIGLIYVVGLPDNRRRRHRSSEDAE